MYTNQFPRHNVNEREIAFKGAALAPVDVVLAEARHLRAQELTRLLRAGLRHAGRITIPLVAPIFGWNRRHARPSLPYDRQASLVAHVRALRADAERGKTDYWLGHSA